jgi:hypothetical protein
MKSLLVVAACAALFLLPALTVDAASGSGSASGPACQPGAGPCQETVHFAQYAFVGSPLPGCTTLTEDALISSTGNGVQHINVNAAQDFWTTLTMVGATTVVQGSGTVGNFIPDPNMPTFTGHMQQWFGEQVNNKNASLSGTTNFQGISSTGASVSLHFNLHFNSTAAAPGFPNMSSMHFDVSCS